jgi:hypothetical protein
MQNEVTLIIDSNGNCKMVMTAAAKLLNLTESLPRRASHVYPENVWLRILFFWIRTHVSDESVWAAFTRKWPCLWRVDMYPVGGGILPTRYTNRLTAIDAEVEALNNLFIGENQ